jgi:hypothetical protein
MKYICLGYIEPGKFENMSESERNTMLDECFSYNDELRKNGHLVAEEPLQPANTAVTVYWKNGNGSVSGYATLTPPANGLRSVGRHVHRQWWSGERGQCKPRF